jgi:hypothetical protein
MREEPDDYEGPLGRKNDPVYEIAGYVDEEGNIVRTEHSRRTKGFPLPSGASDTSEPTERDTIRPDTGSVS